MPDLVFTLRQDYIELGQLLKAASVVGSGGEVKEYLASREVRVNGEAEARRGRKIRSGDLVEIEEFGVVTVVGPVGAP